MCIKKYVVPQMVGSVEHKGDMCVIEFSEHEKQVDAANKEGWNSAVDAAVKLMETGAGVNSDYLREQLTST